MKRILLIGAAVAGAGLWSACSNPGVAGGAGSETTNSKVVCTVHNPDGSAAADVRVTVRPSNYLASVASLPKSAARRADTVTDAIGGFAIASLDTGDYRIEINNGGSAILLACTLTVRDSVNFGIVTLKPASTVRGQVAGGVTRRLFAQIYGLERVTAVDSSGGFLFRDLPEGDYSVRLVSSDTQQVPDGLAQVRAYAGDSVSMVVPAGWRHSRRLVVNTAAAGVAGDVFGFPLLVRLDGSSLDFGTAAADGRDIRFYNASGRRLAYEIEQWDPTAGAAAIWVLVDTVRGNDSAQSIIMLWGNDTAASLSNGATVFDTANGFGAVWHLADDVTGPVRDATVNANNGRVLADTATIESASSAIGKGIHVGRRSQPITVPDAPSLRPGRLTVSAWVNLDTALSGRIDAFSSILSKENWDSGAGYNFGQFTADSARLGLRIMRGTNHDQCDTVSVYEDSFGSWIFVAVTFDGTSLVCYRNGLETARTTTAGVTITHDTTSVSLGNLLRGALDEVELSGRARDGAWIRLSYENQRRNSVLVEFK